MSKQNERNESSYLEEDNTQMIELINALYKEEMAAKDVQRKHAQTASKIKDSKKEINVLKENIIEILSEKKQTFWSANGTVILECVGKVQYPKFNFNNFTTILTKLLVANGLNKEATKKILDKALKLEEESRVPKTNVQVQLKNPEIIQGWLKEKVEEESE